MKYIFLIIGMFAYSADMKSAQYGHIKSKKEQIRDVVFADFFQFSHEDLMAFGSTSQDNDHYLRAAFDRRKEYVLRIWLSDRVVNIDFLHWHRYGSRAEYKKMVYDSASICTKTKLTIGRLELADKGAVKEYFGTWSNFQSELCYKPIPFYSIDKQLYFFGHGWINVVNYASCGNIVCYKLGETIHYNNAIQRKGYSSAMRCLLHFKKQNGEEGKEALCQLLEFPHLLKAILDSAQATQEKIVKEAGAVAWAENDCLLFDLEKITIPYNYNEWAQYYKKLVYYATFDWLPRDLAYAITKRYEEQSGKDK